MRHQNSVLHHVLKLIPWSTFDRLVSEHGSDDLVRRFKTRHQFIALLYGQLAGARSLREIEVTMASHQARLYHAGGQVPRAVHLCGCQSHPQSPGVFRAVRAHAGHGDARDPAQAGRRGPAHRLDRSASCRCRHPMGPLLHRRLPAPRPTSSTIRTLPARSITPSAPPTSMTSPPRRRCRSCRERPMSSISATTIMPGGRGSIRPAAAS